MPEVALVLIAIIIIAPFWIALKLFKWLCSLPEKRRQEEERQNFVAAALELEKALRDHRGPPAECISVLESRPYQFDRLFLESCLGESLSERLGSFETSQGLVQAWRKQNAVKASRRMHRALIEQTIELKRNCAKNWRQAVRTSAALYGDMQHLSSIESAIHMDVWQLISVFETAHGEHSDKLQRLYQVLATTWEERGDCADEATGGERSAITVPATVQVLSSADSMFGGRMAYQAARCFHALADAASKCCAKSYAVRAAKDQYQAFLKPYMDGDSEQKASAGVDGGSAESCPNCTAAYELLELPIGANKDTIAAARRELARSLHPDAWGKKRGVRFAEEQLKRINAACDHLTKCQRSI